MFGIFNLGGGEIILIILLVLILFGAKKLPELAKGLGQGIKEFKKASKEVTDELHNAVEENHYTPPPRRIEPPTPVVEPTETAKAEPQPQPQPNEHKA